MSRQLSMHGVTVMTAAAMLLYANSERAKAQEPTPESTRTLEGTTMNNAKKEVQIHPFVGTWLTKDGYIRHELLSNGRYDEARGEVKSAYQGRYRMTGDHIDYVDDTGFTADGDFRDGILYHAGMVLYRER